MSNGDDRHGSGTSESMARSGRYSYFHPVVAIALLILVGVFALIGYSMFDQNGGLLGRMATATFARGLITYLFAVVTISTAVLLIVSALTGDTDDEKFQRGKEILSLLLGVFGTIVGFYFGSEVAEGRATIAEGPVLTAPLLDESVIASGQTLTIMANVSGGTPPYRYGSALGEGTEVDHTKTVREDGWIVAEITAPDVERETTVILKLSVLDAAGRSVLQTATVRVLPAAANQDVPR